MRKFLSLLLSVVLFLMVVPAFAYDAGTYTGTGQGMLGEIKVEVTFGEDAIENIEVVSCNDSAGIADVAIAKVPADIVTYQSLGVDAATSATITSMGILEAVADAVAQAGGDVEALKDVAVDKVAGEEVAMEADVVIIGGGGAGLAAATAAAEGGASVILVEKGAAYGGNTILSGGYFQAAHPDYLEYAPLTEGQKSEIERYIALEPKDERMAGWQAAVKEQYKAHIDAGNEYLFDSPELHMIQTYDGGDYLGDSALIEMMAYKDVEAMDWLSEHGFTWKPSTVAIVGSIWMRCKASDTYASGQGFIKILGDAFAAAGGQSVFDCKAEHLIQDETGKIVGVTGVSTVDGTPYSFKAGKGVVLACGGFGANVEMRQEYDELWGNLTAAVPTTNAPTITGDGIVMAKEVGAALTGMGQIQMLPLADPVSGRTSNVIGEGTNMYVNQEGKRFVDESSRRDVLAKAILAQTGSYCYVISTFWNSRMDADYKNNYHLYLDDLIAEGAVVAADTLEELAEKIGCPADVFVETCTNFNKYAAESNDPECGRVVFPENAALEMEGPFYACKRAPAVHHTMGGIKVNTKNQVEAEDGSIIAGLYAAGEVTGGFHGSNRLGGNAVSEVIATGRNAATNLLAE